MHEVITTSFSPHANSIATHFYNLEESHLHIGSSDLNPDVHFQPTVSSDGKTASYNPRNFIWDYANGFGSLNKFEYTEDGSSPDHPIKSLQQISLKSDSDESKIELLQTHKRIVKNDYQIALDCNSPTLGKLSKSNTLYWSDFSRVIYKPNSLHSLKNWYYDPSLAKLDSPSLTYNIGQGYFKSHPERPFQTYSIGSEEYNSQGLNFTDESFRKMLESCDLLNGLNIITEIDTAWSGFSAESLCNIKEDYLSDKASIFTWGLTNGRLSSDLKSVIDRVRSMVSLIQQSSLYIPLETQPVLSDWVDYKSLWQVSSFQSIPFEFVNSLFNNTNSKISMNDFQNGLSIGSKRNIISDINCLQGDIQFNLSCNRLFELEHLPQSSQGKRRGKKEKQARVSSRSIITKPSDEYGDSLTDNEMAKMDSFASFDKLTDKGTSSKGLISYESPIPFDNQNLDSFPVEFMQMEKPIACSFDISDKPKIMLKNMFEIVSRYCKGDEREELRDDLEVLKEEYNGDNYDSDSESDDDY
ncbi:hypothetical protein CANARDRAFT_5224 [[Candida] arabinofermentans NRRL YB-2248]|uniref:Protein DML1 n=1 Tax=[Candida] arabinofermentans NRRL YB-2248 TaxID=983967 RepID=A0A1E4T832_9ASCO|nr:hypothetical protein CANARDRAFT_5224 [[Candida] arabinofermentans NRRL YB-2248]